MQTGNLLIGDHDKSKKSPQAIEGSSRLYTMSKRKTKTKVSIYFDGGIGDWIVYDSHWSRQPDRIYWASRARPSLQPLIEQVHPHIEHIDLWANHSTEAQTYGERDVIAKPKRPEGAEDWTAVVAFPRCRHALQYRGCSFLRADLGEVSRFELPDKYVVCQHDTPFNQASMRRRRQIGKAEWSWISSRTNLPVVVLGSGDSIEPPEGTINLCGQTTVAESIEILKRSSGYYGIDSWLSILACQIHPVERLAIKYDGSWYRLNHDLYTAPHSLDKILHTSLGKPLHPFSDGVSVVTTKTILFQGELIPPCYSIDLPRRFAAEYQAFGMVERWDSTSAIEAGDRLRALGLGDLLNTALGGE